MKKFLSIIITIIIIFTLFIACNNKITETLKLTKKVTIGVCISSFNDKYLSYLLNEMRNYSESLTDVEVIFVDSHNDSNIQLAQVEDFISKRVDALIVNPVHTDSSKPITDKAKEANIPIISITEPFLNQNDAESYIASDAKQAGTLQMEYLAKLINYKGNVAIMMGVMGDEEQRVRTEAYHEVIEKYPEMKIVAEQTAEWDRSRGTALMQNWLESDIDIDVVASNNDEMAIGALQAIEDAGKLDKIIVGSIDATPAGLEYLKNGKLDVTVFQDGAGQARCAIETAIKISKGEKVQDRILWKNELALKANVDKYIGKWNNQ